jgi:phosphoglycolate phosphatase
MNSFQTGVFLHIQGANYLTGMEKYMKYQHVIWDWNGTLLNDRVATVKALDLMLRHRNLGSITPEEYRERIIYPVIQLYYDAGFDLINESYEDMCEEYARNYQEYASTITLHENAANALAWFKERGVRQHIVSASEYGILVDQISEHRITEYFDTISGQKDKRGDSKEHLAMNLMAEINADPAKVLFIGDTLHDYEIARNIGAHCFLVSNGHCSEERLLKTGAPVFPHLGAILQALKLEE